MELRGPLLISFEASGPEGFYPIPQDDFKAVYCRWQRTRKKNCRFRARGERFVGVGTLSRKMRCGIDLDRPGIRLGLIGKLCVLGVLMAASVVSSASSAFADPIPAKLTWTDWSRPLDLAGPWRFSPGDSPGRAEPSLGDRGWREIQVPAGSGRTDATSEIVWFRIALQVGLPGRGPTSQEREDLGLGLLLGKVDSAYEVYAGGLLLGGVGEFPPEQRIDYDRHGIYRIPQRAIEADGRLVVALRIFKSPQTRGTMGAPTEGPFLLGRVEDLTRWQLVSEYPALLLASLFFALGLFHLELFRRRPHLRGYLWFAVVVFASGGYIFLRTQWKYALSDHFMALKETEHFLLYVLLASFVQLIWTLLGVPLGRRVRLLQTGALGVGSLVALTPGLRLNVFFLPLWQVAVLMVAVWGFVVVISGVWNRHPEARIMAVGISVAILAFGHDMLVDRGFLVASRISAFGFAAFVISLAACLSNQFLRIHQELEELRQNLEERVDQRTRELFEANQAKSRFLATMSHEMRTPLNGVLGMTHLLLQSDLNTKQLEYVEVAKKSGDLLLSVIDDVLDFSRIEAGKIEFEYEPFDLEESVAESLDIVALRAEEKGLELLWQVSPTLPKKVMGDAARLRQMLVNLVGNGIKFTNRGQVRVTVEEAATGGLHFRVEDTGIGIPEERLGDLFQAFGQIDNTHRRRYGGTGLGLAISHHLCEQMGGRMWVESNVGEGSEFHFTLPWQAAEEEESGLPPAGAVVTEPAPVEPSAARSDLRILLVEDDTVNQIVTLQILEHQGYAADLAENGLEALAALEQASYGVVLLDLQMPKMDGLETIQEIRRRWGETGPWVIAVTANAVRGDREACLAAGMNDYLSKPLVPEDLSAALRVAAERVSSGAATEDGVVRRVEA